MLELTDISVRRSGQTILDVDRLALGEGVTAILGHNGSGKSTLMRVIARRIRPDTGTVRLDGGPLSALSQRALARRLAYLPQRLPEAAGMSVRELVKLGRFAWRGALRAWAEEDRTAVDEAMALTGISLLADRQADSLSGGERQRAWVAMLLAQSAPMLLLDEPTSALDLAHQYELAGLLEQLNREAGRSVVVILHDINLATRFADRLIVMHSGRVAFDGDGQSLMHPDLLGDLFGVPIDLLDHTGSSQPVAVVANRSL